MGFFKKLLGLERSPGEPEPLPDEKFDETVGSPEMPVFIVFFSLWCSSCQVMLGLLNEVAPEFLGRARFYKMDAGRSPHAITALGIRGVPVLAAFAPDGKADRTTGLMDITELRNWIESHITGPDGTSGQDVSGSGKDRR